MARVSYKVYEWTPKKGKGKCLSDIYYAAEENKDTLFNIHITHKMWGRKWYNLVQAKMYDEAIKALVDNKKIDGLSFVVAVRCIEDLAFLESEIEKLDVEVE